MNNVKIVCYRNRYDDFSLRLQSGNDWEITLYGCVEDLSEKEFLNVIKLLQANASNDVLYKRDFDSKYFKHFFMPLESVNGIPLGVSHVYNTAEEMEVAIDRFKRCMPSATIQVKWIEDRSFRRGKRFIQNLTAK